MSAFALRYARAFQQVSAEQHLNGDAVRTQLADFSGTFHASHELREFLANPSLESSEKLRVLDAIASRIGLDRTVRNFVAVLMDHGRLGSLDEIIVEYERLVDEAGGIAEAEITSARPLDEDERGLLAAKAGELAGSKVRVAWREDAGLLGGATIRLGSRVFDGSVRGQLEQMRQHLAGA